MAGSTDWGVELNIRHARARADHRHRPARASCGSLDVGDDRIDIGAALTLTEIERGLAGRVPLLAEMFPQFASRLIRNGATLGGNLGTGSPIGDSHARAAGAGRQRWSWPPATASVRCRCRSTSPATGRPCKRPDELIKIIRIPLPVAPISAFHKIAKRRFDDISSVAVAFALDLRRRHRSKSIKIGLGGVAATPLRATATEEFLAGKAWTRDAVARGRRGAGSEGTPMSDHRASADYRTAMLRTSLLKFFAANPARTRSAHESQEAGAS